MADLFAITLASPSIANASNLIKILVRDGSGFDNTWTVVEDPSEILVDIAGGEVRSELGGLSLSAFDQGAATWIRLERFSLFMTPGAGEVGVASIKGDSGPWQWRLDSIAISANVSGGFVRSPNFSEWHSQGINSDFPYLDESSTVTIPIEALAGAPKNIGLGEGIDPFLRSRTTGFSCLKTPNDNSSSELIEEEFQPQGTTAKTQIAIDIDYNSFASHSVSSLAGSVSVTSPNVGGFSGSLSGKASNEARQWVAARSIGIKIAHVIRTGVKAPKGGRFLLRKGVLEAALKKKSAFREAQGEFFASALHMYRGIVVTLSISDTDAKLYQKLYEEYEGKASYGQVSGKFSSQLNTEVASSTKSSRIAISVQTVGVVNQKKLAKAISNLQIGGSPGQSAESALGSLLASEKALPFDEVKKFVAELFDIFEDGNAGDGVGELDIRRYAAIDASLQKLARYSRDRSLSFIALRDLAAEMELDREMVTMAKPSGPHAWLSSPSVISNENFGKLARLIAAPSFAEFLKKVEQEARACRIGDSEVAVPESHPYKAIMPSIPAAPVAYWRVELKSGKVLDGADAVAFLRGLSNHNTHPFFVAEAGWNGGGAYTTPYMGDYQNAAVKSVSIILDTPYLASVDVGITGGVRDGNNNYIDADDPFIPGSNDSLIPVGGSRDVYRLPVFIGEWSKPVWPVKIGSTASIEPMTPRAGVMRYIGRFINRPQCVTDTQQASFGKYHERAPGSFVYLRINTLLDEYIVAVADIKFHYIWATHGGDCSPKESRGGSVTLRTIPLYANRLGSKYV